MSEDRTSYEFIFENQGPFLSAGAEEPERREWIDSHFYASETAAPCVRKLRGSKMRTTQALMNEFGAALQFFDGFGENWHALEECLSYLDEWLPSAAGYVLPIPDAHQLLADQGDQLEAFLITAHSAGEFWSRPIDDNGRFNRPARPFHVLLLYPTEYNADADLEHLSQVAAAADVPIRLI